MNSTVQPAVEQPDRRQRSAKLGPADSLGRDGLELADLVVEAAADVACFVLPEDDLRVHHKHLENSATGTVFAE
jgi:hypothetical protein